MLLAFTSCGNQAAEQSSSDETVVSTVPAQPETPVDKGQELFIANCSSCHGASGTAGIGGAVNLQKTKLDSVGIAEIIQNGRRNMPSFKGRFNEEKTAQIVSFIETLKQ
ncbi:MAG TPA: c-type cytochrome [Chitinophagales bacterium]